ncbi:MAG: HXXEE domain-containing protein [Prevotella sp.]
MVLVFAAQMSLLAVLTVEYGFIWLFPSLFLIHDLEEVLGLKSWIARNGDAVGERFPRFASMFRGYSTEGMVMAVVEEYVLCILFTALASTGKLPLRLLWYGAFAAYTFHLVVHVVQSVVLRKYVPAVATSILLLPISTWLLYEQGGVLGISLLQSCVYCFLGFALVALNLILVQRKVFKKRNVRFNEA